MKSFAPLLVFSVLLLSFMQKRPVPPNDWPVYAGNDLGVHYSPRATGFRVWAPEADAVTLRLYGTAEGGTPLQTLTLKPGPQGSWFLEVPGDLRNRYYTFEVRRQGQLSSEVADPWARAVGVNGKRGMIVSLAETNPAGWATDRRPPLKQFTDIILYELHVRDLSMHAQSGIRNKGKYLGLTERGTKNAEGFATGLDHIRSLGVTHIHLLPAFDHNSIDESRTRAPYNWGYDPLHYNTPEGSYASNATDGRVRIREFKQMVKTLHDNGLRVVLDVVYNHTSDIRNSVFTQFAPGYFYRQWPDGRFADGSGCGNETASERAMMRKYMMESVAYWAREYHIDGFRFDLMGLHDIETMNAITDTLQKIDPTIFVYGEGWTAGNTPLPENDRALKKHTYRLKHVAAFSDDIRDALRGPFSDAHAPGFISGKTGNAESLKFGIVAATAHPQVEMSKVNYSKEPWAREPWQSINYVSCHDDPTLFDRIRLANPEAPERDLIRMDKLAQAAVLTSQGVVFLHAGEEMLRTKNLVHNSYNAPDSINAIDWSRRSKYPQVFRYYQGLVALRKNHPAFRIPTAALVRKHLRFLTDEDPLFVGYEISGNAGGDRWKQIIVLLNGNAKAKEVPLPAGNWKLAVDDQLVNEKGIRTLKGGMVTLPGTTAWVLFRE